MKFISLRTDTTFKYLFKNPKFKKWFSEIIYDKCGIDLLKYEFVDAELNMGNGTKDYRLDNLLRDPEYNYIIVEMQNRKADNKNTKYLFRVSGNILKQGSNSKIGNVVLIQFDGYDIKNVDKEILHFVLKEENLDIIKPGIEIYEFILPKFKNKVYNEIDKRLSMFTCESYEDMRKIKTSKATKEIIKELELLSMDENFSFMYDAEAGKQMEIDEARKDGMEEGLEQGRKQGLEQEKMSVIENLYKMGISIDKITEAVELPEEKVAEIINNIKES